jgi:hypothetical protein
VSTTLSMTAMVARLQRKTGLGLGSSDCVDFLNEAFRKVNQMSKGGFIWQLKTTNLVFGPGATTIAAPSDFDAGKTAVLRGDGVVTPLYTIIPYRSWKEFVNEAHFQTTQPGSFSCWTFSPNFTAPLTYGWTIQLGPPTAAALVGMTLPFVYHAVNFPPVALGPANYFPTPDQFDSMIVDLAIAEVRNIYRMSGEQSEVEQAVTAISQVIDTYRTDRIDLAGLSDQMAQAQEKQTVKAK